MPSLELALRLLVIGQELLIAVVFLASRGIPSFRISGGLLLLSIAAYLYVSSAELNQIQATLTAALTLAAILVPYFLWIFALEIFEADRPSWRVRLGLAAVPLAAWLVHVSEPALPEFAVSATGFFIRLVSLFAVGHALYLAAVGWRDDLIERRRYYRGLFIAAVGAQTVAILVVELILGSSEPPAWLTLLNVVTIALLTAALALPLLELNPIFFPSRHAAPPGPARITADAELAPADSILRERLLAAMAAGAYRQNGLTIGRLADELDYPEYRLRRLINGHLGFRNFTAFLNSYRIAEAKERLADPGEVRVPVLTIALEVGYGSIGPFNRAFRLATKATPTEFRRQALGHAVADSE